MSRKAAVLAVPALALALGGAAWWRMTPRQPAAEPELDRSGWERKVEASRGGPDGERPLLEASRAGTAPAVEVLVRVASSEDRLAPSASLALTRVRNPAAKPVLREAARAQAPLAAGGAIQALGAMADPADVPLFIDLLGTRRGHRAWQDAAFALGKSESLEAARALEAELALERNDQERMTVLEALRTAGRPESAPALERFLARNDLAASVRSFAEAALRACRR